MPCSKTFFPSNYTVKLRCQLNLLPFKTQVCRCFMLTHVTLYLNAFHTISWINVVWRTQATFCIKAASSGPQNVRGLFFPKDKQSIRKRSQFINWVCVSKQQDKLMKLQLDIYWHFNISIIWTLNYLDRSAQSPWVRVIEVWLYSSFGYFLLAIYAQKKILFWQQIIPFFVFRCHTISGKCFCKSGFTGLLCDQQISEILT